MFSAFRNVLGRQHVSALRLYRPLLPTQQLAPITTNRIAVEEQKEFWEKNEVRLKRPLSPHLSIYSLQTTSTLSLLHRTTGLLMGMGIYGISYALVASSHDFPSVVEMIRGLQLPVPLIYSCKTLAAFTLVYHYLNGMRHMAWDLTWGFGLKELYRSAYGVLALSVVISAALAAM